MPRKTAVISRGRAAKVVEEDQHLKKNVAAIHTSGSLTLLQRKLSNVLLFNAYDDLIAKRTHKIPLPILCAMIGWETSNNIDMLRDALRALASTTVEFNLREEGEDTWRVMSMISFGEIKGGFCTYRYDEELAEKLFDPTVYAMINLRIQRRFDAGQALNLYENCLRFKNTNSTGWWTLDFFRSLTGTQAAYYDQFMRLNDRVIKPCVKQINEVSDIHITPITERENRRVTKIKFEVREKTQEEKDKLPQSLPGLSFGESVDEYAEFKTLPVFKSLRDHGISERLAIAWIRDEGAERVESVIAYVETQDQNKKVKGSTAGYITTLIREKAEVKQTVYEQEKVKVIEKKKKEALTESQSQAQRDAIELKRKKLIKERREALTKEQFQTLIDEYRGGEGSDKSKSYRENLDSDLPGFKEPIERIAFNIWLGKRLVPDTEPKISVEA
jgi:Initiator Replication protein